MRKRITGSRDCQRTGQADRQWLDLEQVATVEVTSEDPGFPIESVFASGDGPGWRASQPGEQQIRLIFDRPVSLHRIHLRFHETGADRTQEFVLRWAPAEGAPATEIVRQQWNFSPQGATTEVEDYAVDLESVSVLELVIQPGLGRGQAVAVLQSWRVGE